MSEEPQAFASTECGPTAQGAGQRDAPPSTIGPGTKLGRYVIERRVGEGGMGMVFAAHDPQLDRLVALKVLRPRAFRTRTQALAHVMNGLFGDDEASAPARTVEETRLLREAQAAAALSHPNVVTINDVGRGDAGIFIAMEFIKGRTLRQWWGEKLRRPEEIVATFVAAARGLAAAHDAGLVHRDFKPDNVMVADDGRVLVVDFGLVGPALAEDSQQEQTPSFDALSEELTRDGSVLGTPAYMAPEQHYGTETDARTDQFSFCASLWEGLVGARPFRTAVPDLLDGSLVWPGDERRLPRWRFEVLCRGLSVLPDNRWPSMDALVTALVTEPRATRRRRRALVGVGAFAVVGALSWQGRAVFARHRCELDAARIDATWNDEARERVSTAMIAAGAAYAEGTASKFGTRVDDFVRQWHQVRSEACLAAAFGEDPDAPVVGTIACLDRGAESLASLLEAAGSVELAGVRGALSAAAALRPPSRCAEPAIARRFADAGPAPTGIAAEIRNDVHRSSALESMGRYAEALTVAQTAARKAEAHGQPTLVAATDLRVGLLLGRTGQHDAAIVTLERAANELSDVGEDGDAARAGIRLAYVFVKWRSDAKRALHWARWAESYLQRTEDTDIEAARSLHGEIGTIYGYVGDPVLQLEHHERQLALAREHLSAGHPGLLPALNNLGSTFTDVGRNEDGLKLLEEAVEIQDATLPPNHPDVAMTLTNIAQLYWLADRSDEAATASKRALDVFAAALGENHPRVGSSHANYALVLEQLGRRDEALTHLERAVAVARANGEDTVDLAVALSSLADSERRSGHVEDALAHHTQAMAILEAQDGHDVKLRATVAHGTGNDFRELKRYPEALVQFEIARAVLEAVLPEGDPRLAIVDLSLGKTLADLARGLEAKTALERALAAFVAGKAAPGKVAAARLALATALELTGDRSGAREHARTVAAMSTVPQTVRDEAKLWLDAHD